MERDGNPGPTAGRCCRRPGRWPWSPGGAIGTAARYGGRRFPVGAGELPVGTFGENVLGAALLGLLLAVLVSHPPSSRRLRLLLATGTLGAFATFSIFAVDTVRLAGEGASGAAALNGPSPWC